MGKYLRYTLSILVLGVLFLPMLQQFYQFVEEPNLEGITKTAEQPLPLRENWMDGTYQDSLQAYVNQNFGFQKTLIRLNNQYYFSLFNTAIANGVIIGKDNYLYDLKHIKAYTGEDFIGDASMTQRLLNIQKFRQILAKKGIQVIMTIVPGKATGTPSHLPTHTLPPGEHTNYKSFARISDSLQLPLLDLIAWYRDFEPHSPYPLYPSGGIHWSQYCSALAADTLLSFVSQYTNTALRRFQIDTVEIDPIPRGEDADIARGMNLFFDLKATPMAYPHFAWTDTVKKLSVLTVGDSYFFTPFIQFAGPTFERNHLFFYYNELHVYGNDIPLKKSEVDLIQEIESMDLVMLYVSDPHVDEIGWGFIEDALKIYEDPQRRKAATAQISERIRNDEMQSKAVKEKAIRQGLSFEAMLEQEANTIYESSRVQKE